MSLRPAVAAVTLPHDHAEHFRRRDVIDVDGAVGRVLHVDVRGERITVDFYGVLRRAWWRSWGRYSRTLWSWR